MGIIAGLLAMFFWGTAIFLAAKASRQIGNKLTLFWMQVFGFIIGSAYLLVSKDQISTSLISPHIPILIVVSLGQLIAYLAFYKGLEKSKVSLVSPIGSSWGLIVAMLGIIILGEKLTFFKIIAVISIITGIVLLSTDIKKLSKSVKVETLSGVKEGVIAMFGWGLSLFLLGIPTKELDWFLPAYIFRLFLIIMLGGYIYIKKEPFIKNKEKFPLNLLITIGALDIFAFFSYSYGITSADSSLVAPIASAFVLVSISLAWIFLKEKINRSQLLGISGIIIGLILISL